MNINLTQIATIQSPFCNLENMPIQPKGAKNTFVTIEFKKEYQDGLKDLDGFSHIYLIYYFHKVSNHQLTVVPFNDENNTPRGIFSTRTPLHPNKIGLSIVELISVEQNIVTIKGIDVLDGTPLLDIKPYIENFDKIDGITKSGWMKATIDDVEMKRSDNRFI
ncbi:tRNA (N6-threonylcarbamoyladenosine(37)-N6)-methyltransferase TrmO [Poseidonibacter sp.]|uniref:tRNA (N6-threonylcarbamoyladenosine(37)-N6)-methyltransferase TrmO n=1 Tax=Poseidonibacter sp. TaxID=2321188 RepID=UPI003C741521